VTAQLLAFAAACLVVIIVPGPDFVLMMRNAARAGHTGAAWTAAGILLSLAVLGLAAALGLTALLAASESVSTVVRIAGGIYLIYLGVQSIRSWLRLRRVPSAHAAGLDAEPRGQVRIAPGVRGSCFRQGLISNLLNPKVVAFYLALFPQFDLAPLAPAHVVLAAAFWVMCLLWYIALVFFIGELGVLLQTPKVVARTEAVAGGALIGLGGFVLVRAS
jgi:threonine/homoserine/homoserine lactone efflux protein